MTLKNSASCNTESECDCDVYSGYWEEIVTHDNEGLVESDSESDLYNSFNPKTPCSSFENEKRKSKLSETELISEKSQNNFIDCPLLHAKQLENTRQFQAELCPESVLHFEFKDCPTNEHPSKPCTSKTFLSLIITEKLVKEPTFYPAFDKACQRQPLPECPPVSKQNKAVQVSFPYREAEIEEHSFCDCSEQSAIPVEVNRTPVRTSVTFHSTESTCSKNTTSSQLIKEHLDSSSEPSYKIDSPQAAEQIYSYSSSGGLVISLKLESASINPSSSLARDVHPSNTREDKEDSQKHALLLKLKDPQHNSLFKKLRFSIIPCSVSLDTESPKQTPSFTKQKRLPQILVEAIQPLTTHSESSESSSPDCHTDQVPSTLKPWFPKPVFPSSEHTHATNSSYLFIRSFPCRKNTVTYRTSELERHQLKASRPTKSVVFTKNKVQRNHKHRNKRHISSKYNWPRSWDVEATHQNTTYQAVNESEINELYFVPLKQTTRCHCSPLLDLTVDLFSEGRYSSVEQFLSVKREPHKQTRSCKVTPRFSFQYILNGRSSFEKLHYISPIRKKNSLKMQNILNSCLGWAGRQDKQKSYNSEVCSLDTSNTRGNGLFTPHSPADRKSSTSPLLLSSKNNPIPPPAAPPLLNDRNYLPDHFLQTERKTWTPASLNSDCKYSAPCSYCANIVNIMQLPKERNMVNAIPMGELDSEPAQMLVSKKFSVCPCGNVPQCGLFPNGDISLSVRKKIRASSDISQKASMTESNKVNYPRGTLDTAETYCTSCHHPLPTGALHNVSRQETSKNYFTKTQSCFPMKNLKDVEEKSKAVKTDERKRVRIPIGPGTLQEIYPSGTHTASPTNSCRVSKYFVYQPECCSSCQTADKQHLGISRKLHSDLTSKHEVLENCLNRESVFLANCGRGARSQCKCCQAIPLFCIYQTDTSKGNRAAFSKREETDLTQPVY
ncbi:uncharacterized protein LOC128323336 isoform X2 [Hemicordylus capensis]|uniref:uncharacterized protein LOC128323336 isoform X2 n=1 Tax=Hemicordylus capensis TaxID=884348 RepID=UPI0023025284|nr:uncharacterized protein LOC128323336 isoform X2 [Hemicordylus capensis]